jgi:hypothetical protein
MLLMISVTINTNGNCEHHPAARSPLAAAAVERPAGGAQSEGSRGLRGRLFTCPSLAYPHVSSRSENLAQQLQLDDWLLDRQPWQQQQQLFGDSRRTAGTAGQYMLYLLPGGASAADLDQSSTPEEQTGGHSEHHGAAAAAAAAVVMAGRHRHAWMFYSPESAQQHPHQLLQAVAAASVQLLSCCFALHASQTDLAAAAQLPVSAGGATRLSFSLLNAAPLPGHHHVWDFSSFNVNFLVPLAARLSAVTRVSVESQVLLYTPARNVTKWSKKHQAYVVRQAQLPFFIDSEWAVESGRAVMQHHQHQQQESHDSGNSLLVGSAAAEQQGAVLESHVLHFLVYIPAAEQQPLLLLGPKGKCRDSNSFWIPSWGGLLVLNPSVNSSNDTAGSIPADSSTATAAADGDSSNSSGSGGDGDGSRTPSAASSSHWHDSYLPLQPRQLEAQHYNLIAQVVLAQLQALFGVAVGSVAQQPGSASHLTADVSIQVLPAGRLGFSAWQVSLARGG